MSEKWMKMLTVEERLGNDVELQVVENAFHGDVQNSVVAGVLRNACVMVEANAQRVPADVLVSFNHGALYDEIVSVVTVYMTDTGQLKVNTDFGRHVNPSISMKECLKHVASVLALLAHQLSR